MTTSIRTAAIVGVALVALAVGVRGAAASTPVDRCCATAFPSASSQTTGGVTLYNRQASVQAVECGDFGSDGGFHVDRISVACSLLSAAIGVKFENAGTFVDGACSPRELAREHDVGGVSGVVCGVLSDLLGRAPWAKAYAIGLGLACTFGEPTGSWIESKREQHAAEAVWADHKCIKYSRHSFPRTDRWSAVACASNDPGFTTLAKAKGAGTGLHPCRGEIEPGPFRAILVSAAGMSCVDALKILPKLAFDSPHLPAGWSCVNYDPNDHGRVACMKGTRKVKYIADVGE